MKLINQSVDTVNHLTTQIATTTEQQSSIPEKASKRIVSISDSAEHILKAAEELNEEGARLKPIADDLYEKVKDYKVND